MVSVSFAGSSKVPLPAPIKLLIRLCAHFSEHSREDVYTVNTNQIHLKLNPKSAFIFFSEPPFAVEHGLLYQALTILCMQALRVVFLSQFTIF